MTYGVRYWLTDAVLEGPAAAHRRLANSAGVTSSGFAFVFPFFFPAAADCCFAISVVVVIAERLPRRVPVFPEARVSSSSSFSMVEGLVDVGSSVGAGAGQVEPIFTFLRFSCAGGELVLCFAPFGEDRGPSCDSRNPCFDVLDRREG